MQIQIIKLKLLHPHPINRPLNPNPVKWLRVRMEKDGYDPAHPIPVRKNGKGYQMAGGNQRRLAAEAIGLTEVPCIVKSLTDEQIVYEIMRDNAQDPVHPIHIGSQLNYMRREMGTSIRVFAKEFKLTKEKVQRCSRAAVVYDRLKNKYKLADDLYSIWRQLAVIYSAGQMQWLGLAERAIAGANADAIRQLL
jgi:ParB-like chromosome segregation protein Spo0J